MQGPFDYEMNSAMLKMTGAKVMVTKDSGEIGGFEAKAAAAIALGCELVVIARPVEEDGYTLPEMLEILGVSASNGKPDVSYPQVRPAFFPMFFDMLNRKILVIGGGKVASRRTRILASYGANVTVISPKVSEDIETAASSGEIRLIERKYKRGDIAGIAPFFVIAATNNRQANHEAMLESKSLDIPASIADNRDECTCCFPAIAETDRYIAGIVSKKGDHTGVKQVAERVRGMII